MKAKYGCGPRAQPIVQPTSNWYSIWCTINHTWQYVDQNMMKIYPHS